MMPADPVLVLPLIEVTASTAGNFVAFNRLDEDLDSDWLMQPVLEAQYDSETQCCVDGKEGGTASFADHYVTKRKKKMRRKGKGTAQDEAEDSKDTMRHLHVPVPKRAHAVGGAVPTPAPPQGPAIPSQSMLSLPDTMYDRNAVPRGSLSSTATRRIATGAAPPGFSQQRHEPILSAPPSYSEATASCTSPSKRRFSNGSAGGVVEVQGPEDS